MTIKDLTEEQKRLRRRVLEIIYQANNTHIGSCLTMIDIIEAIYSIKKKNEKFILSNGHAGVALYVVLEKHGFLKNPSIDKLFVHPDRDSKKGIDLSTGSLGQGLPVAVGMALANRGKKVYCSISDGECMEGSIYEALRVIVENNVLNLIIVVNFNGYAAYRKINLDDLVRIFKGFGLKVILVDGHNLENLKKVIRSKHIRPTIIVAKTKVNQLPFLQGIDAHYHKMTEADYQLALKKWSKN